MSDYLVTGAAGFIGSNVCTALLDAGHHVIGVDDVNDAYDVRIKEWRLNALLSRDAFTFFRRDIRDRDALDAVFADAGGDSNSALSAVIHLAARAGVRQSLKTPALYYQTNVLGTLNLLECCRASQVSKFVFASSSSLYGQRNPVPYREDHDTDHPVSPYAASKKAAETLCYAYHALHGMDITVFRYFTVYGPAGRPDMAPLRFVQWIAEGRPLTLFGDGSQSRDFTYIDDIVRGTVAGLAPVGYRIINLGSDRPHAITELISLIEECVGKDAIIDRKPTHPADVDRTWADISVAREVLHWSPSIPLREGVQRLVDWYMENREWASKLVL